LAKKKTEKEIGLRWIQTHGLCDTNIVVLGFNLLQALIVFRLLFTTAQLFTYTVPASSAIISDVFRFLS